MYYPSMLNLEGKKAVVVGGGNIATRKVQGLLEARANITVISPVLSHSLFLLQEEGKIQWKKKKFESFDIKDSFLVIAATNDSEINRFVYDSINEFQLINVVDNPALSNFIVPSSIQRGKLIISVSTSGASPSLSSKVKEEIGTIYGEEYTDYLLFLQDCREIVKREISDSKRRKQILKALLEDSFLQLTKENKLNARDERFRRLLEKGSE